MGEGRKGEVENRRKERKRFIKRKARERRNEETEQWMKRILRDKKGWEGRREGKWRGKYLKRESGRGELGMTGNREERG